MSSRSLSLAAAAVATLDDVSGGRAFLGIGAGGSLDLVFANGGQPNRVCLGDGSGGFICSEVIAFDGVHPTMRRAPATGEHNEPVLRGLVGVTDEEYTRLVLDDVLI